MRNGYYISHRPSAIIRAQEWYLAAYEDGVLKGAAFGPDEEFVLRIYRSCVERKEIKCDDLHYN